MPGMAILLKPLVREIHRCGRKVSGNSPIPQISSNNFAGSFPTDEKMTRAGTRVEQPIRVFLRSKEEISHVYPSRCS
jgi:hypothetical protein